MKFLILLLPSLSLAGVLQFDQVPVKKHEKGAEIRILADKSSGAKSAFFGHLTIPAKGKVPVHRDKTEEYIYVLEGEGMVWINGALFPVKAGSTIFMPADAEVSFQNGPKEMKVLQVFAPQGPERKYETWKAQSSSAK